jgi:protein TonB
VKPDEPDEPKDTPDMPQVVNVVAAADPASVAFAVPVQGAVAVSSAAHVATPPPLVTHLPSGPVKFSQNTRDGGSYPSPYYPSLAMRNHLEGTATVEIKVDETGAITSANVQKSSGSSVLDEAAIEVVKKRWRFPPGQPRWLSWSCTFRLE